MVIVIYLFVGTHKIHVRMIHKDSRVTVVPLAVKLYKIPVMAVGGYRVSRYHHVGNSRYIKQHLAAAEINVTVAVPL